ncbi:unnamed protein product [Arabidopsis thaliana]|uniref:Uncharacterized protein n=3 Tax=Arabidopsis thaliana TaxID=3702 RepID=A0A654GB71_ARATH|nr:hydroxyproline-rich glycoprotein family protein [Arabidopsis thaliana]AAO72716.1 unknown protein [Arabidopsis thaliana]ABD57464.1 At5g55507 [Arabidopsis thaliana]AED96636.1 hydroxyproline-rich glycoprotein family protein [Arabidopsis thaliana]CAA0410005.1 unnamed protein product [Arabidopsis thaliana]VYS70442.1 unnamed protein product [Arabidopsis thaliana]|eukprot:NP_680439.1 hydroxyproline-rich glycoprotein family protein [Arabidopsis thaliana]
MDYGHVTPPPPQNFLPPWQQYSPMYQQVSAPMSPMSQYMNYQQFPYTEQQQPPATYPYYYYPYYVPEMWYSSPPQLPTRDGVTGEPQCRIL